MERSAQGIHKGRIFDNQDLPKEIKINLASSLNELGGAINGILKNELIPNTKIAGLPAIWYPHSSILKKDRLILKYMGLDEYGKPTDRVILPSGWILMEGVWLPLTVRLLREVKQKPEIFNRVNYQHNGREINFDNEGALLTSLGAADNQFFVNYSKTFGKWLVMDQENIGYKSCGIGTRVYGTGCYFGGFWTCADYASAKKVDDIVCKTKNPPWPTKYFLAAIDDVVYNAGLGSSIKSGRMKLLKEL